MNDVRIFVRIEQPVSEEYELWQREAVGATTTEQPNRLESLQVSLDQCWYPLSQWPALPEERLDTEAVRDPSGVRRTRRDTEAGYVRDPDVESCEQWPCTTRGLS